MFQLIGRIPKGKCYLACSGGIDSMVVLDFLLAGQREPTVLHFNHKTEFGNRAKKFVQTRCKELNVPVIFGKINSYHNQGQSKEEYWRDERYFFLNKFVDKPIITAHHLDDATEWWIFSCLHGEGKIIPYKRDNIIRPFLLTPESEIVSWAKRKSVIYLEDPGNADEKYMRSIIRHKIMPEALRVNPGLRTVVKRKIKKYAIDNENSFGLSVWT